MGVCCFVLAACAGRESNEAPAGATAPGASPATRGGVGGGEVEFAREAFRRLANGDASAEEMFDWENLKWLGDDLGAEYKSTPGDAERAELRRGLIEDFSSDFKASGASVDNLTNWREESSGGDGGRTTVAADGEGGAKLIFVVARAGGRQKIVEFGALEKVGP